MVCGNLSARGHHSHSFSTFSFPVFRLWKPVKTGLFFCSLFALSWLSSLVLQKVLQKGLKNNKQWLCSRESQRPLTQVHKARPADWTGKIISEISFDVQVVHEIRYQTDVIQQFIIYLITWLNALQLSEDLWQSVVSLIAFLLVPRASLLTISFLRELK